MSLHNQHRQPIELRPREETADQHLRIERRAVCIGPPTGTRERRDISVREVQLSEAEWEQYFAPMARH